MTNITLAERVKSVKPSPTLGMAALAARLKAEGKPIISLATGEPDFDTPSSVKEAAIKAIEAGFTKYTPADGIVDLKKAVIEKFKRDNHLTYTLPQVMISAGAKDCLYNLIQAVINPGDEVIIPAPYWVSYPDIVLLAEGKSVIIPATFESFYKITPEQLEKAITPKTKFFIINSPSNPSGKAYTPDELKALSEVLLRHPHVLVITDDIYEAMLWEQPEFTNILNVCPDLYPRTFVLNSLSKTYAMTGWRIGYAAGPAEVIEAMTNIQSQSISNPTSIAQKAAIEALNGDQQCVKDMMLAFKERHHYLYEKLRTLPGVRLHPADGTFYLFLDVSGAIKKKGLPNDAAFIEKLLLEANLALVPGSAFGIEGCVRLSFAASMDVLKEAVLRLEGFILSV